MLHVGVLPNHRSWGDVLANLAFVVVDEAHVYRGVFGSHVAQRAAPAAAPRARVRHRAALRAHERHDRQPGRAGRAADRPRLRARGRRRRAARRAAGGDLEPAARGRALRRSAHPRCPRPPACWPALVEDEVRTICFLKSRRGVELIQKFARLRLEDAGRADLAERIAPYRAGLHGRAAARDRAPAGRRRAAGGGGHRRARAGHRRRRPRRGDVRDLPRARWRACARCGAAPGRRETGLALYVAGDDALDQFFCRHPDEFLDRPVESAILDHESEEVHLAHLLAAAYEMPLTARRRRDARARAGRRTPSGS